MPTGNAPTTSEWLTILMPTNMRLIFKIWWYVETSFSMAEEFSPDISALHIKGSGTHLKTDKKYYHDVTWASGHYWPFVKGIQWFNSLKPGVKSRIKMQLEQHQQAMLQLHLNNQQVYCLLSCDLYERFDSNVFQSLLCGGHVACYISPLDNLINAC